MKPVQAFRRQVQARRELIVVLQGAHAGELAATFAYEGHAKALGRTQEAKEILGIQAEEIEHRACVGRMLAVVGGRPAPWRERVFRVIGRTIGALCHVGGWFIPMYGAGRLERGNVGEYEVAARLALEAGYPQIVEELLDMAEVEWDHDAYFRRKCEGHWMRRLLPMWKPLPPRAAIRERFEHRTRPALPHLPYVQALGGTQHA